MQLTDVIATFRGIARDSRLPYGLAITAAEAANELEFGGLDDLKTLDLDLRVTAADRDNARTTLAETRAALAQTHAGLEALEAERNDALAELSYATKSLVRSENRRNDALADLTRTRTQRDDARRQTIVAEAQRDQAVTWGLVAVEAGRILTRQRDDLHSAHWIATVNARSLRRARDFARSCLSDAIDRVRNLDRVNRRLAAELVAAQDERDRLRAA
jgi:hypothetical protein